MKIRPEHYNAMLGNIKLIATPDVLRQRRADLKLDPKVKDLEKRLRWDMLWACGLSSWLNENVYPYANDDHIDTALRSIMKEIEQ